MDDILTYRGKTVTQKDVSFIRTLIEENPEDSRWSLSRKLCWEWDWRQPNGALRDMVCRGLMLELHRAGHIRLPEKKQNPPNPLAQRKEPPIATIDQAPNEGALSRIRPLRIRQVRRTTSEKLFNSLIEQYHYLGYCQPVGAHLKYLVFALGRVVACITLSSAPRHIGCRDRFIGWSAKERRENLHLMAYNSRFLILPWVRVPHLASHILGQIAKQVSEDWKQTYNHPIHFQVPLKRSVSTKVSRKWIGWLYICFQSSETSLAI